MLSAVRAALPDEAIVYVADQRYAPYGDRTLSEVASRSVQIGGQLIEAGSKVIVVACNSASAAALLELRDRSPHTPFVGMEPAVKPAALRSRTGVVGVLATSATFQGELFASVVDRHANGAPVIRIVGAGLASLVEAGAERSPEAKRLLDQCLAPALDAGMDTLVLGCTHYPYLRPAIASVAGDGLEVIDPAPAVARQVARVVASSAGPTSGRGGEGSPMVRAGADPGA